MNTPTTQNHIQQKAIEKSLQSIFEPTQKEVCGRCAKPKRCQNEKDRCHCGRPLKYSLEMLEKAQEYIAQCKDEEIVIVRVNPSGRTVYKHVLEVNLPTIEGLALYLEVNRDTIYAWRKAYGEFSDTIDKLLCKQAVRLINKGLGKQYSAMITKLMLIKHGYSDRAENTGRYGRNLAYVADPEAQAAGDRAIYEYLAANSNRESEVF